MLWANDCRCPSRSTRSTRPRWRCRRRALDAEHDARLQLALEPTSYSPDALHDTRVPAPTLERTTQETHMLGYELDEAAGWSLPISLLEAELEDTQAKGVATRALVVINPGGQRPAAG